MLYQSVQIVVHIEGPLAGSALVTILRESHAVSLIVFIEDMFRSGQLLPDAQPAVVVPVLEGIQVEICRGLVHGLQHEAQATVVIVHIIGVELFGAMAVRIFVTIEKNSLTFFCQGVSSIRLIAIKS